MNIPFPTIDGLKQFGKRLNQPGHPDPRPPVARGLLVGVPVHNMIIFVTSDLHNLVMTPDLAGQYQLHLPNAIEAARSEKMTDYYEQLLVGEWRRYK